MVARSFPKFLITMENPVDEVPNSWGMKGKRRLLKKKVERDKGKEERG